MTNEGENRQQEQNSGDVQPKRTKEKPSRKPLGEEYNPAQFMAYLDTLAKDNLFSVPNSDMGKRERPRIEVSAVPIYDALVEQLGPQVTKEFEQFLFKSITFDLAEKAIETMREEIASHGQLTEKTEKELLKGFEQSLGTSLVAAASQLARGATTTDRVRLDLEKKLAQTTKTFINVHHASRLFNTEYKTIYNQVSEPWRGKLPHNRPAGQYQIPTLALLAYELAGRVGAELAALEFNLSTQWKTRAATRDTTQEALDKAKALVAIYRDSPHRLISRYSGAVLSSYWLAFTEQLPAEKKREIISPAVRNVFTGGNRKAA